MAYSRTRVAGYGVGVVYQSSKQEGPTRKSLIFISDFPIKIYYDPSSESETVLIRGNSISFFMENMGNYRERFLLPLLSLSQSMFTSLYSMLLFIYQLIFFVYPIAEKFCVEKCI